MPANTQYLVAAYGIVISVVLIYGVSISLKLSGIKAKLKKLQKIEKNEKKES